MLFISTHLVSTRHAPICRSKTKRGFDDQNLKEVAGGTVECPGIATGVPSDIAAGPLPMEASSGTLTGPTAGMDIDGGAALLSCCTESLLSVT